MMFLFPKKELNVDVFTFSANVYNFTPVIRASKALPKWWIDSKKEYDTPNQIVPTHPTIKKCEGMRELFSHGMMFRTPVDMYALIGNNRIQTEARLDVIPADNNQYFDHHDDASFGEFLKHNKYLTLRINLPYLIKTKESISWTLMEPLWASIDPRYRIVSGNTDFSRHHTMSAHILFQHSVKEQYRLFFPMHTPLIHAIAHTEKKLKIHNHLISKEEYINKSLGTIPGMYSGVGKYKKENKCPFH